MAINVASSGVFPLITVGDEGTGLHIRLSSIDYAGSTMSAAQATGDYRALLRGIHETYYNFMTGTATGTDNVLDFNKPSFFTESRSNPSVASSTTLKRNYTSTFTYELNDPLQLPLEPEA